MRNVIRQARFFLEAILLYAFYGICKFLPPAMASNLGGWLVRSIGPHLNSSHIALENLTRALPENSPAQNKKIIRGMWDNLGRVMAEYPHLETIGKKNIRVVNPEILEKILQAGTGGIFISAHIANWEINGAGLLELYKVPAHLTYRAPNNPFSDRLLKKARTLNGRLSAFPKSRTSARELMKALKDKQFLGILIDQKFNEGLSIPFFGLPAMTNPAFVSLAQKFGCPVIPIQPIRTGPARFDVIIHNPLPVFNDTGEPLAPDSVLQDANLLLEKWIRQNPGQWLWIHRRWKWSNSN